MNDAFRILSNGAYFDSENNDGMPQWFAKKQGLQSASASAPDDVRMPAATLSLFMDPTAVDSIVKDMGGSNSDDLQLRPAQNNNIKVFSRRKVVNLWKRHSMQVDGSDVPQPITHFSDLVRPPNNVPRCVVNNLFDRNHKIPTAIQMQVIPSLLNGRDVIACAPTGSGKTIGFLVPLFARLKLPEPNGDGVRALIITPTMELAMQIEREAFFLIKGMKWKLVQHGQTTKGKDLFVTTPARVLQMIQQKKISLHQVEFLVFDEGDKLWDETTDFLAIMDTIIGACTNSMKVVSLFSATLSEKIEQLTRGVMKSDSVRIIVNDRTASSEDVEQTLIFTGNELGKVIAVRNLIREGVKAPVLIFVQSIERTKELFDEIRCSGLHVDLINSKMSSSEREAVVLNFRLGKTWFLITTELLARGIDFKSVGTVINFDFPVTPESYVHRVGRTGRAGRKGKAVTFFTEDDKERLPPIVKIVLASGNKVEPWMAALRLRQKRSRVLQHQTPHRTIVSTKKRVMVAQKRVERQLKAQSKATVIQGDEDE